MRCLRISAHSLAGWCMCGRLGAWRAAAEKIGRAQRKGCVDVESGLERSKMSRQQGGQ